MNLFDNTLNPNILPYDGTVKYFGRLMTADQAACYLKDLFQNIAWKNDEAVIFGRHIITKRKAAWYADTSYRYTYSNTTKQALPWTKELLELKELVEKRCETQFNSCLLNLYHSGEEGMAWHSDDERSLGRNSPIASLSLGAERKFSFKHKKTKESISIMLEDGSLLLMKENTQANWLHSLPKSKRVKGPRINLTFRNMLQQTDI